MKKVNIYYNPYLDTTRLIVDGVEHKSSGKRFDKFIVGQPIECWLSPYVYSYRRWSGILAELIEELNDDEIDLSFYTLPEFFQIIEDELKKQETMVEEKGYESCNWILHEIKYFEANGMISGIKSFIQTEKHFISQYGQNLLDYAEEYVAELEEDSCNPVDKMKEIYKVLRMAIESAQKEALSRGNTQSISHWKKSERTLDRIFGGK